MVPGKNSEIPLAALSWFVYNVTGGVSDGASHTPRRPYSFGRLYHRLKCPSTVLTHFFVSAECQHVNNPRDHAETQEHEEEELASSALALWFAIEATLGTSKESFPFFPFPQLLLAFHMLGRSFAFNLVRQLFKSELRVQTLGHGLVTLGLGNGSRHWAGVIFFSAHFLADLAVDLVLQMWIHSYVMIEVVNHVMASVCISSDIENSTPAAKHSYCYSIEAASSMIGW